MTRLILRVPRALVGRYRRMNGGKLRAGLMLSVVVFSLVVSLGDRRLEQRAHGNCTEVEQLKAGLRTLAPDPATIPPGKQHDIVVKWLTILAGRDCPE